jgi:ATP-dependent helicase/DNAse subunit B
LQSFAACPYKFLLSAIYRLAPREEAVALQSIDPVTRGAIFHRVQAQFVSARRQIYFSYPRVEVALARPRVPSFYALDVARTTLGHLPNVEMFEREAAENKTSFEDSSSEHACATGRVQRHLAPAAHPRSVLPIQVTKICGIETI